MSCRCDKLDAVLALIKQREEEYNNDLGVMSVRANIAQSQGLPLSEANEMWPALVSTAELRKALGEEHGN